MSLDSTCSPCEPSSQTLLSDVRLYVPTDLSPAQWERWSELQRENRGLQSPYFRPEFTQAVARVRSDVEVAVFQAHDQVVGFLPFQRGPLNMGKPVGGKLCDFHGCIGATDFLFD